jgi:hypothetical protein
MAAGGSGGALAVTPQWRFRIHLRVTPPLVADERSVGGYRG